MRRRFIASILCMTLLFTTVVYADEVVSFNAIGDLAIEDINEEHTISDDDANESDKSEALELKVISGASISDSSAYEEIVSDSPSEDAVSDDNVSADSANEILLSDNTVSIDAISDNSVDSLGDYPYQAELEAEIFMDDAGIKYDVNEVNSEYRNIKVTIPLRLNNYPVASKCKEFILTLSPVGFDEAIDKSYYKDVLSISDIKGKIVNGSIVFECIVPEADMYIGSEIDGVNVVYKINRLECLSSSHEYMNVFTNSDFANSRTEGTVFNNCIAFEMQKTMPTTITSGQTVFIPAGGHGVYSFNAGSDNLAGVVFPDISLDLTNGMKMRYMFYYASRILLPREDVLFPNKDYFVEICNDSSKNQRARFLTMSNGLVNPVFYETPDVTMVKAGSAFTGKLKIVDSNVIIKNDKIKDVIVQMYNCSNGGFLIGSATYSNGNWVYSVPTKSGDEGQYEFSGIYVKDVNGVWTQGSKNSNHVDYRVLSIAESVAAGYTGKNDTTTFAAPTSGTVTINVGTKAQLVGKKGSFKVTKGAKNISISKTGKITFKKKGKVVVKYTTNDGVTVTKTINVKMPSLKASKKTVKVGKSVNISLKGCDMVCAKWSAGKNVCMAVADDNLSVTLTGLKKGKCKVTAKINGKKYTTTITVK